MKISRLLALLLIFILGCTTAVEAATKTYVYVANNTVPGSVSVIDAATNSVVKTLEVGGGRPTRMSARPDGTRVFVNNREGNFVSVIDTESNTVIATVPVGQTPEFSTVTPDGKEVYVSTNDDDSVSVINTDTNTLVATIPVSSYPRFITATLDGKYVFVTPRSSTGVDVIDVAKHSVVNHIEVGDHPSGMALSPDGSRIYICVRGENSLATVDLATQKLIATTPVGNFPVNLNISPDGNIVYVVNRDDGTVSMVDTTSINNSKGSSEHPVLATVPVGATPWEIVVSPDSKKAYLSPSNANATVIIDAATQKVSQTLPIGTGPYWTVLNQAGTKAFATLPPESKLAIIDTVSEKILATPVTGINPWTVIAVEVPVTDIDTDGDGVVDALDNCPTLANADQADSNANGIGDACEVPVAPVISQVSPATGKKGTAVVVTLTGSGFSSTSTAAVLPRTVGCVIQSIEYVSPTTINLTLNISSTALIGQRGFSVTTDGLTGSADRVFVVTN